MNKKFVVGGIIGALVIVILVVAAPDIRRAYNNWRHGVNVAHDETDYETLRSVENTARAMISSWNADRNRWLLYNESDDATQQEWASQARMRANNTASTFNNFILENNYIWRHGVPEDLRERLPDCLTETVAEEE